MTNSKQIFFFDINTFAYNTWQ